jgi:hypothetical protein
LAEILPIESADMCYEVGEDLDGYITKTIYTPLMHTPYNDDYIPCWSLAALLDVLNKTAYFINENGMVEISSFKSIRWSVSILNCGKIEDCYADNLVDACVAMVEKLHELNLL